ncbi:MAG: hypothetical protein IJY90_00525 [Clostridia bacterium]|nr:hypothetical protein [Clostridia bacterium]
MAKSKITKSILKTVAAGFACAMCCAFFPATAVANALENYSDATLANVNRISVNTGVAANEQQSIVVKKGEMVTIPAATYSYKEATTPLTIGEKDLTNNVTSEVVVTEKATGDEVKVEGGKFLAEKVGVYTVTYKVVDDNVEYSYDLNITAQATEASFDFEANIEDAIPNIYDISIANNKDVVLPLPTVMGENEKALLKNTEINNYITGDTLGVTGDVYVKLALTNGGEGLEIKPKYDETDATKLVGYYISGEELSSYDEHDAKYTYDGKTLKVVYSFYQTVNGKAVYVASTSKTFTVKANYYYTDSTKETEGYDLVATLASKFPDAATVGVETTLPGVLGTTDSKNSPANEGVSTYYQLQVLKMDKDGKYTEDVTATTITDGNKFTAKDEGNYKFIYTVKDFYTGTEDATITRIITNVKDTKSASAFMYDAANPGFDAETKTYQSVENNFKTKGVNRNIIMYAIGGTDNMDKNTVSVRREIRNYSGIKEYVIEEELYNNYNLIFAPKTEGSTLIDLYQSVIEDNFALRTQLELKGIVTDTEALDYDAQAIIDEMQKYYLIVTNEFNKDAFGNPIISTEGFSETTEDALEQLMAQGYAYVKPQADRKGTFNNQSYTFYYFADDGINKETSIKKDIEFMEDYNDESVPTLTFSSDLQASYLATDTFKFNVVTATDDQDSRIKAVTAYRYVAEDKKTAIPCDATKSKIEYYAGRIADVEAGKWYNKAYQKVSSENWFVDTTATEYTVDLTEKPQGAAYVEIFAYAIDDNGNVGFFNKFVAIADATDLEMPELIQVKNAPTGTDAFKAPDEIALPTLKFSDDKINLATAKVSVYKITRDENTNEETGRKAIASYGMNTRLNTYLGTYTVNGGYFRASVGGKYQVAITVVDAAEHSVTSYFTYNVADSESETLDPTIDNISSLEEKTTPNKTVYLTPPSISLNKEEGFAYIGLDEDDETNTATWYNVEAISATSNDYKILDNLYFSAGSEGTYKLKYTAYLIKYATSALTTSGEKLVVKEGKLYYNNGTKDALIYLDADSEYALAVEGLADVPQFVKDNVEEDVVDSDAVITITVSGASLSINDSEMNLHYDVKTEYEVGDSIEVIKPVVDIVGTTEVDPEKTTISITRNSTTLATIKLSDWNDADEDIFIKDYFDTTTIEGKVFLKFHKAGKYTISYNVDATVGGGDTYSVTLSAGDVVAPELEIKDEIVEEGYKVGDTLHIAFSHETVADYLEMKDDEAVNTVESLLEDMVVKIKYESNSYETLDNEATEKGYYDYSYDLNQKGTYTLSITITDADGNSVTKLKEFEVGADKAKTGNKNDGWGGALIGLSVALLAGVIIYFVVSKKKLDKKEKSYRKERSNSRRK